MSQISFQSRKEKELFLREIIQKLHITEPEKDIYSICIEILEDDAFDVFFMKIIRQFETISESGEPLNLIAQ